MKQYKLLLSFLLCALVLVFACTVDHTKNKELSNIQQMMSEYADAYNRKDAAALAQLWTQDAFYLNPQSGQRIQGRDNIQKQFQTLLSGKDAGRLKITIETLELHDVSHALQKGVARVSIPGRLPTDSQFTAQLVKVDGKWLIQSVTENDMTPQDRANERLKDIGWLVGRWVNESSNMSLVSTNQWDFNNHFMKNAFSLDYKGRQELAGEQIIGWDPFHKQLRSWIFDSEGGFGEGTWTSQGNRWTVHVKSTLPGGQLASSIHTYTLIDSDTYKFQVTGREIDGIILPNIEEVSVVRKKSK